MDVQLLIEADQVYQPAVLDGITWETNRFGTPGKLTFTVLKDDVLNFQEGAKVQLTVDGKNLFFGYVFSKKRNKDNQIQVVAYDQLRYLKNKDTYVYTNKTATEVIQMIAKDFRLTTGELEDTGYKIPLRSDDNKTLFDVIQNALDLTLISTRKMYVLYDDFGKLVLKNIENMKLQVVIDEETAEDYNYETTIDGETYNQIKLSYLNKETQKREIYIEKDGNSIERWGVLQYFEDVDSDKDIIRRAQEMLPMYNRKTRRLSISGALGDVNVRAGCSVPVILNLGDIIQNSYLICERVTHTFQQGHHSMDMTMSGGDGFVS